MAKLFAISADPDQIPYTAGSDLELHCLPVTLLWVSRLKWVMLSQCMLGKISADDFFFLFSQKIS